jgi:hypothetical protein
MEIFLRSGIRWLSTTRRQFRGVAIVIPAGAEVYRPAPIDTRTGSITPQLSIWNGKGRRSARSCLFWLSAASGFRSVGFCRSRSFIGERGFVASEHGCQLFFARFFRSSARFQGGVRGCDTCGTRSMLSGPPQSSRLPLRFLYQLFRVRGSACYDGFDPTRQNRVKNATVGRAAALSLTSLSCRGEVRPRQRALSSPCNGAFHVSRSATL